jgi:hypothetical protein
VLPPRPELATTDTLASLLDVHVAWAWVLVISNGLAGIWSLGAHWIPGLRTRALWWFIVFAEVAVFVQVGLGVGLIAGQKLSAPKFHLFYGFVAIIAVGILYGYRDAPWMRNRLYQWYGFGGLFVMGLGIRAMLVAQAGAH